MCSANIQQIYRRTPKQKNELSKFANQLYWNQISAWVFSCKYSAYLQESCFDEYLWETASANFHSTCFPYFSIRIRVKFRLLLIYFWLVHVLFRTSSPSSSRIFFVPIHTRSMWMGFSNVSLDCLFARWCLVKLLLKCCLNCYVAFPLEKFLYNKSFFLFWYLRHCNLESPPENVFSNIFISIFRFGAT